ncbi:MAG: lysylphosphatidylglycerol synthase transmembrane domain-containing protein [Gemmatimonadaceae bacterium]
MTGYRRTTFLVLRIAIGVGLLAYLGSSGVIDWSALLGLLVAWPVTLIAFLLVLIDMVVTAWRLCLLFRPRGLHLSVVSSVRLTLIGTFFNACLPGSSGGDLVKIYYASAGNHGRRTEVATIMVLDRIVGMLVLLLWPLAFAPFFPELIASSKALRLLLWGAAAMAAVTTATMLIALSTTVRHSRLIALLVTKIPMGVYAERVLNTVHQYRHNRLTLLAATAVTMLAHTIAIGATLLIATAASPGGAAREMVILIPIGFMANVVPVTPGGLGVGEAAFDALFAIAGLSGGAVVLLGWRLLLLVVGLLGLALYLQGQRRLVEAVPAVDAEGAVPDRSGERLRLSSAAES